MIPDKIHNIIICLKSNGPFQALAYPLPSSTTNEFIFLQVLECCKESKVFKASNPYIAAILSVMAEIYATAKLKLNLCFEIEMLFRSFGLTIAETRLSKELSTRKRDTITGMDYTLDKPIGEPSGNYHTSNSGQRL